MYSNRKNTILIEPKDLKLNDLVLFIDNNSRQKHINSNNGWCDEMYNCINKIGIITLNYPEDDSCSVSFNNSYNWSILYSCLLKISDNIKRL